MVGDAKEVSRLREENERLRQQCTELQQWKSKYHKLVDELLASEARWKQELCNKQELLQLAGPERDRAHEKWQQAERKAQKLVASLQEQAAVIAELSARTAPPPSPVVTNPPTGGQVCSLLLAFLALWLARLWRRPMQAINQRWSVACKQKPAR